MAFIFLVCLLVTMYAGTIFYIIPQLGGIREKILVERLFSLIDEGDDLNIAKILIRKPDLANAEYAATLPLIEAVRQGEGDLSVVLTLLAYGADPNAIVKNGLRSAVHQAIYNDDDRYLAVLMANDGDATPLLGFIRGCEMESKMNLVRQYVDTEDWPAND